MTRTRTQNALLVSCVALALLADPALGFAPVPAAAGALRRCTPVVETRPAPAARRTCLKLRESSDQDNGETFTGGNELALRILIEKNRMARETADRAYIPMDVAVRWARRLNLWRSMEEWEEWIDQNKHSNPFIPPNPEEYYTARGVWLGWRYWLGDFE